MSKKAEGPPGRTPEPGRPAFDDALIRAVWAATYGVAFPAAMAVARSQCFAVGEAHRRAAAGSEAADQADEAVQALIERHKAGAF